MLRRCTVAGDAVPPVPRRRLLANPVEAWVVFDFNPSDYGTVFSRLIDLARPESIDAGQPVAEAWDGLNALTVKRAFEPTRVVDQDMARCCVSATWLHCNYLDESHVISQGIDSTSGSYWHGIMHRREGDFSNSKYWMRRVGRHAIFADLAAAARQLEIAPLGRLEDWDSYAFVDACAAALHADDSAQIAQLSHLQRAEWQLLFDYCYRAAVGE